MILLSNCPKNFDVFKNVSSLHQISLSELSEFYKFNGQGYILV